MTGRAPIYGVNGMATLENLLQQKQALEAQAKQIKKELEATEQAVSDLLAPDIAAAYGNKNFGTVHIERDGIRLKVTTPKRVDWDGEKLAELYKSIGAAGDNPNEYIKIEYSVSEAAYNNWPSNIAEAFEPARTVKPGKMKIEVETE